MLILVGVTINVALNGGLFGITEEAASKTQIEAEKEQLLSAVVTAYDTETGTISKTKLQESLGNTWKVEGEEAPYTVTSPKGNKFTVNANGTIDYKGKTEKEEELDPSTLTDLEKYIYGADGKGRDLSQIVDTDTFTFKQDPTDTESNIHENIKLAYIEETKESESEMSIFIRYNREVYKFVTIVNDESETIITKPAKLKGYTPEGNLGKYVTYQGKSWIVLYDNADKVELISAEALGEVALGCEDAGAKTNVTVTDENSLTGEEKYKRGAWSYNNVITTLTEACKAEAEISTNIRNVGGLTTDTKTMEDTVVFSNLTEFTPKEGVTFEKYEGETNGLKQGDENYLADYNQMKALGILVTDTPKNYWLASRLVEVDSAYIEFGLRYVDSTSNLSHLPLCGVNSMGNAWSDSDHPYSVRPVVSLSSGILDGKTEEGTRANPINLD